MPDLRAAIEAERARWGHPVDVHRSIHGTDEPGEIAGQLTVWCREVLGREVAGARFHLVSVGSVTGLELDDGELAVIKAFQPRWSTRFLSAVVATQRALAEAGVPCAEPIGGPAPLGEGLATAERHLPDPGQPARFGPTEMAASAAGLALLIDVAPRHEGLRDHPMGGPFGDELYPTPHSPLFDFEATAAGAEWIDDLARTVLPALRGGPEVVAHMDWSARNVRLGPTGVRAVYDMDSLSIGQLAMALAGAAATWRSTAEPGDPPAPDADEIDAWLDAWPHPLGPDLRAQVFAGVVYQLAYASRCEHAVDPAGTEHRRARPTLRADADRLLERAHLDPRA